MLTPEEEIEIQNIYDTGNQASDLIPLLRNFAQQGSLDKIPEAIYLYTRLAQLNKNTAKDFLFNRVPALLINFYLATALPEAAYHLLLRDRARLEDRIRTAAQNQQLQAVTNSLIQDYLK